MIRAGNRFRQVFRSVVLSKHCLALQVGAFDKVAISNSQLADAGAGETLRLRGAQRPPELLGRGPSFTLALTACANRRGVDDQVKAIESGAGQARAVYVALFRQAPRSFKVASKQGD